MKVSKDGVRMSKDELFELTNILSMSEKKHFPYIVLDKKANEVKVVWYLDKILSLPDDTEVLWQWQGNWSSDFFLTSVGEIRKKISEKSSE